MWVEKNGPTWRVRDRVNGHKTTIEDGYPTKTMAKAAMMRLAAEAMRGEALVPNAGRVTIGQVVGEWWPEYAKALKPTALHSEGGRVRHHILGLLGNVMLEDLDVPAWVRDLESGTGPALGTRRRRPLAAKSVHNCHGLLFMIMDFAVERRYVRANPCAGRRRRYLPKRLRREMRCLTDPEIKRLLNAVPAHWRPLVFLLVSTGLRWGEAVGLRVGRIDLLANKPKLLVVEHLHELSTGEIVFTDPKTQRSRRTVSFPVQVALTLVSLVSGKEPDELVFTTARGAPVRTRNFRRGWLKWTKAAGLGGLRVHDLRHTHAGILLSAHGLSLAAISRRLGHSSIAVTDQLYGHLREEADPGVLAAVEAALASISAEELMAETEAEDIDETDDPSRGSLGATSSEGTRTEPKPTDKTAGQKAESAL